MSDQLKNPQPGDAGWFFDTENSIARPGVLKNFYGAGSSYPYEEVSGHVFALFQPASKGAPAHTHKVLEAMGYKWSGETDRITHNYPLVGKKGGSDAA